MSSCQVTARTPMDTIAPSTRFSRDAPAVAGELSLATATNRNGYPAR